MLYKAQQIQEPLGAGISAASAGTAFVAQANEWLQFVALLVAIVSGGLAIYAHIQRKNRK